MDLQNLVAPPFPLAPDNKPERPAGGRARLWKEIGEDGEILLHNSEKRFINKEMEVQGDYGTVSRDSRPRRKWRWKDYVSVLNVVMALVIVCVFFAFKKMPSRYMGTSKSRVPYCPQGVICPPYNPDASSGLYTLPTEPDFPIRENIHDRHNIHFFNSFANSDTFRGSFLHPKLPSEYISRVPTPEGAIEEIGLQYPWQTPARWTYPTAEETGEERMGEKEPNEGTGGIPDVASEECLKRATVPWTQKKGTKEYLKAAYEDEDNPGEHVTIKHVHESSPPVGPGGPLTMDGEISVVRAKPGSREEKKNEIGVEFKVKLSGEELFEAVFMRKVGNGTVVLETNGGTYEQMDPCLEAHIIITIPPKMTIPSLTIHSLIFPINIHEKVSLETTRLDLFTNRGLVQSLAREVAVLDSVVLGVSSGSIKGFFPLANELIADCAAGSIDLTTQILTNTSSPMSPPELIPDPEITTSTGSGTALITLLGPIPENRNQISSSHVGASGAQTIMYPEDWEGIVTCQVQVGSCHMWGKGLEIVETRNNNTGLNVYMKAVKGEKKFNGADTSIELRGGPVEVGIGPREKGIEKRGL